MKRNFEQSESTFTVESIRPEISVVKKIPRILIIAPAEPMVGGHAVQAKRLISRLSGEETVRVQLQPINPQLPKFLHVLQEVKYLRTISTSILFLGALFSHVRESDVIHVFSAGDSSFLLNTLPAILFAKLFRKKTLLNYRHGGAERHFRNSPRIALSIAGHCDKIIVPSDFLVGVFSKFGLETEAISNFVDAENYRFRVREELQPVFLSNRSLESGYNIQCILRAFAIIQSEFRDARLFIAGDGPEHLNLQKLSAELGLRNVEFLGNVSQEKMPQLYDRSDIYLNSPNVDNMPTSIIEAFSSGTPVVSTDAGGIPIIVANEESGLLVAKNDHEAMAQQAIRLLRNKEFAQVIIKNAHAESAKYCWERVREDWLRTYNDLAGV